MTIIKYNTILIQDDVTFLIKEEKLNIEPELVIPQEHLPETELPIPPTLIAESWEWGFIDFAKYLVSIVISGLTYDVVKQFVSKLKYKIATKIREDDKIAIVVREGNYEQLISAVIFEFPAFLDKSQFNYVIESIPVLTEKFLEIEKYCKFTVSIFKFIFDKENDLWRLGYKLAEPLNNWLFIPARINKNYTGQIQSSDNSINIHQVLEKLNTTKDNLQTNSGGHSYSALKEEMLTLFLNVIALFFNTPPEKENIIKLIKNIK